MRILTSGVQELSARLERFHRAGLSGALALAAAEEHAISPREIERLVEAGCDPVTALRIVWPLEETPPRHDHDGLHVQGDQSLPEATK